MTWFMNKNLLQVYTSTAVGVLIWTTTKDISLEESNDRVYTQTVESKWITTLNAVPFLRSAARVGLLENV